MSSSVDLSTDVENQAPLPKKHCCSRVNISMGLIETTTAIIAIASILFGAFSTSTNLKGGAYTVSALSGAAFLGAVFVHICWKRDAAVADLHRVNLEMDHTVDHIEDTTEKVDKAAEKLKAENQKLRKENKELAEVNANLDKARLDLDGQVQNLSQINTDLAQENQTMKGENGKLHLEIGQLKEVIQAIQNQLSHFNAHNKTLKRDVSKFRHAAEDFGKTDDNLAVVLQSVDKELDLNIDELSKQVGKVESSSQKIFALFAEQVESLKKELSTLREQEKSVDKDKDDIRDRAQELEALQMRIEEADKALAIRKEEFEKINLEIARSQISLKEVLEQLNGTDEKMTENNEYFHDLNDSLQSILSSFGSLADRIGENVDKMEALKKIDLEQEKEIDQL